MASGDIEQRVSERQFFLALGQVAINDESHRHFNAFPRLQHLLGEAKAFGLVEVNRDVARRNAGDSLRRHRLVGRVMGHEQHLVDRTGMHNQFLRLGVEVPNHVDVVARDKLHPHLTIQINDLRPFIFIAGLAVDTERFAHHVVQRHQSKTEGEHHDHQQ